MKILKSDKSRFWEIDFMRGTAVIMMIVFHFMFDLNYFLGYEFAFSSAFWFMFARTTATIFIFLAGVSLALSYSRMEGKTGSSEITKKYAKRGLKILSWGLLITALTWFLLEKGTIWFGVLHLIGISIILARPLLKFRMLNLVLGFAFVIIGIYLSMLDVGFPWLLPLGLMPANFYTLDYVPIFPWFGIVLLGIFFGKIMYPEGKRKFKPSYAAMPGSAKLLCFAGRHSLLIYLLHQPFMIALLYLLVPFF